MNPETAKPGISPARAVAFEILLRVDRHGAYASELLHGAQASGLASADHRLATELVMGVLRWRASLDHTIAEFSSTGIERLDLEVLTALRLAAYQIHFLERVPARAAIHESVELVKRARKRSAAGFVNAILRKIAAAPRLPTFAPDTPAQDARTLAQIASHPLWMVQRWIEAYGSSVAQEICAFDQARPHTIIHLRDSGDEKALLEEDIRLGPGKLLRSARVVVAGDVTRTHLFRAGKILIQDEASQLVGFLIGRGKRLLDCCAAPGGKTSILAENNPGAEIVALELHSHRARLLRKLVSASNVKVVTGDARALPVGGEFDQILADVPCSGTGTLARNPDIKWRLKPEDLADLQSRQLAIALAASQALAPGGRLLYSTCSLESEENSCVIEKVLSADSSLELVEMRPELERLQGEGELVASNAQSLLDGPFLRTIPGVHQCDGFFAAILKKL